MKGSFDDVKKVLDHLSEKEVSHIYENGEIKEWPIVLYRKIYRNDTMPIGFIDSFVFPQEPKSAYIALAVIPEERCHGLSKRMMDEFMGYYSSHRELKEFTINALIDNDNAASIAFARKYGFDLVSKDADESIYELREAE